MIHIDLSFQKIATKTTRDKEILESKANDHFKYKIFDLFTNSIINSNSCSDCKVSINQFHTWDERNIIEVESEGIWGNHFCEIPESFEKNVRVGEYLIETDRTSFDICKVKEVGKLVNMKRNLFDLSNEFLPVVSRLVGKKDLDKKEENEREAKESRTIFRELATKYQLDMKLVKVHFQFDRKKLFFFYTADGRVDFRLLAKDLANNFKTRIELRQIGVRDEAQIVGGLGSCGRVYCCSTFLNSFKKIQTNMINDQNINTNSSKLTGPCTKLKCCLSFEMVENN